MYILHDYFIDAANIILKHFKILNNICYFYFLSQLFNA